MKQKDRKILAIDDDSTSLLILEDQLRTMNLQMMSAKDAQKGMEMAVNEQPDMILLDIVLPNVDGFELCRQLKADNRTSSIPVIFISAKNESVDKIEGLGLGAIDYVTKPFDIGELRARIGVVLKIIELQEKNLALANTDELTGLMNRRLFLDIFERELLMARMKNYSLALMMLDIDHFKDTNDTYGHPAGDMLLKQMGAILKENTYPLDAVARYGGDEFIILMPDTSYFNAAYAAEKLRRIIDDWQWDVGEKRISVTVSIGIAKSNSSDSHEIIKRADNALYKAKKQGRNHVVCWEEIGSNQNTDILQSGEYTELQTKVSSSTRQLHSLVAEVISAFIKIMDVKDPYIAGHSKNTRDYAVAIANEMGVSQELREKLEVASLLHDIGKIRIPDWILLGTGPISKYDRLIIEQHPLASEEILKPIGIFEQELPIIRQHHERFDGSGYPDCLKGREIVIGARILAVADVFDAMTSIRPYRMMKSCQQALKEITEYSGTQFDPEVVEAFQDAFEKHKTEWPLSSYDSSLIPIQEPWSANTSW
jgi:diguanylate cyclase (GGDEF)-like protein